MSLLPLLISSAHATELATVTTTSSGFGPLGVLVFFVLLAVGFFVLSKKSPDTADAIVRAGAGALAWFLGLFKK